MYASVAHQTIWICSRVDSTRDGILCARTARHLPACRRAQTRSCRHAAAPAAPGLCGAHTCTEHSAQAVLNRGQGSFKHPTYQSSSLSCWSQAVRLPMCLFVKAQGGVCLLPASIAHARASIRVHSADAARLGLLLARSRNVGEGAAQGVPARLAGGGLDCSAHKKAPGAATASSST